MPASGSDLDRTRDKISLEDLREPLTDHLSRIDDLMEEQLMPDNPILEAAVSANTTTRGKRMRPILLLLSAEATGGVKEIHLQVGAILELIHAATLVHDDVLDQGEFRRQHITVNEKFGNELAVLFGDFIFSNAYILTVELDRKDVRMILSNTARDVCKGEIWQTGNKYNYDLTESTYLDIIRLKTASLFAACGKLGATINRADEDVIEAFEQFGTYFGMAFQIVDDYLDLIGEENLVGKSLGTDLHKGKLTLPVLELFSRMSEEEKQEAVDLIETHGRPEEGSRDHVTEEDVKERELLREAFTDWMTKYDLMDGKSKYAREYLDKARDQLGGLGDGEAVGQIERLIDFAEQRYR